MTASDASRERGTSPGEPGSDHSATGQAGPDEDDLPWHRRRWTTIVLEESDDGWRATQTGVDVEGHGATAADAAAAYCRRISQTAENGDGDAGAPAAGGRDG